MLHRDPHRFCSLRSHGRVRWNRVCHLPAILNTTGPNSEAELVSVHSTAGADHRHGDGGGTARGVAADDDSASRGLSVSDSCGVLHGHCVAHDCGYHITRTPPDAS